MSLKLVLLFSLILTVQLTFAQDSSKTFFNSSVGMFKPIGKFKNSYQSSLTFNSGIERKLSKYKFVQLVLDYNAIKYNQKVGDNNSNYLFQKSKSSIFLASLNLGSNIFLSKNKKIFYAPYAGLGYVNIGEPRLELDHSTNVITQNTTRMSDVFFKLGSRIAFITKVKFFQCLFIDASYWKAKKITIQNSKPQGVNLYIGTRTAI